ncbi:MAG: hemerythrin domain-containing protein [Xanthomonadales bacterium]|nr:hemerythrin domain-containing protein [Xanthomonadales bacterium]
MSESLLMLRLEHRNTSALLNCLEHQLTLIRSGEPMSPRLMTLAIDYFEHFPDQCHHPKEDLIYRVLRQRNPDLAEQLGDLEEDHKRLADTTRELASAFRHPGDSPPLADILERFLACYRGHMDAEETHFFPAALESLTANDWASINFEVFDSDDPLFDHSEEEQFAELRDIINSLDQRESARLQFQQYATRLQSMQSQSDFNQAMEETGRSLRLLRFTDQSWGLDAEGELLFRIPPCSETRAVWCAALFDRGMDAAHGHAPGSA